MRYVAAQQSASRARTDSPDAALPTEGEIVKARKQIPAWVCGALAALALPVQAERFTLLCQLTRVNGESVDRPETSTVVDTDKRMVNGWPAKITDEQITWTQPADSRSKTTSHINRQTGSIRVTSDGNPESKGSIGLGQCVRATTNQY